MRGQELLKPCGEDRPGAEVFIREPKTGGVAMRDDEDGPVAFMHGPDRAQAVSEVPPGVRGGER